MLFEYERFYSRAVLAYRRVDDCKYTFEQVMWVFEYYFKTFESECGYAHPMISIPQICRIIDTMPAIQENGVDMVDVEPEEYSVLIDQHFVTEYRNCDYNINHFFSGNIRALRYYEVLY